jgi:hypothetical protein
MSRKKTMSRFLALSLLASVAVFVAGCDDDDNDTPLMPGLRDAEVRVAHLSPDAPAVDVWVDGTVVLEGVPFPLLSGYLAVPAGPHRIQVTPAGATEPSVIDATLDLDPAASYTVAATGLLTMNDLAPLPLLDDRQPADGMASVRFVHASPDAPAVDVAVSGGPVLFSNVAFREAGEYLMVAPGTYDLEVRVAGTSTVALSVPGVSLSASTNYTIFAIGQLADSSLAALPAIDSL